MRTFSEATQWMAVALSSDGLISAISNSAEQLIGYSAHELVGRPVTAILADRSVFDVPQMLKSANDWGIWEGEISHRDRSGRFLKAHASLATLSARENSPAGFLLLSSLNQQPSATGRDESLCEVAAYLRETAHELNNPLAVMMGFTQLILLDLHCEGTMKADMERLYAEMQRVVQVVERLHSYARSLQDEPAKLRKTS